MVSHKNLWRSFCDAKFDLTEDGNMSYFNNGLCKEL